jgi:hypothetical protein
VTVYEQAAKQSTMESVRVLILQGNLTMEELERYVRAKRVTMQHFDAVLPPEPDKNSSPTG